MTIPTPRIFTFRRQMAQQTTGVTLRLRAVHHRVPTLLTNCTEERRRGLLPTVTTHSTNTKNTMIIIDTCANISITQPNISLTQSVVHITVLSDWFDYPAISTNHRFWFSINPTNNRFWFNMIRARYFNISCATTRTRINPPQVWV